MWLLLLQHLDFRLQVFLERVDIESNNLEIKDQPWILGYSASHNGAVCLLKGSEIVVAIQEERLSGLKKARIRHLEDSLAFKYCLKVANITPNDLDVIVGCYFSGESMRGSVVTNHGWRGIQLSISHHLGHAIGAYVQSGFSDSTILIVDGQGGSANMLPDSELLNVKKAEASGLKNYAEIISIYEASGNEIKTVEKHLGNKLCDSQ